MSKVHQSSEIAPRLLNMRAAATYIGVSYWSLRDYVMAGHLRAVQLPALVPREGGRSGRVLRRILIDVRDLDAFIDAQKGGGR
jgi:hypothetical protein